jgi:mannose-6-phosphate isomerase class I
MADSGHFSQPAVVACTSGCGPGIEDTAKVKLECGARVVIPSAIGACLVESMVRL